MNLLNNTYRHLSNSPHQTLTLLFAVCIIVYLASIPLPRVDGMLIGSDGIGYYMYVRSLVIDHDLDFANEYAKLSPDVDVTKLITPTGLITNQFAVGPAILWAPFFIVAHFIVLGLNSAGLPVVADGYSYVYQAAVSLGSIVYGFLGALLMYQIVKQFYPRTALAAVIMIWLATNFVYYQIVEPSMSHMPSLFAVALLMYIWIRSRPVTSLWNCLAIGFAGGLVGIVRQPDATLLSLPIIYCLLHREESWLKVKRVAVVLTGFFMVFWIQMVTWRVLNGSPFLSGYFHDSAQGFSWLSPHLVEVLFSTEHGLFLWHPILLLATVGLAYFIGLDRKLSFLFIGGVLLQVYLVASWSSWSQGDAFGGRMFMASLPIFAVGLGAFLQWVLEKQATLTMWLVSSGLILWNALFLIQYRLGFISMSGPYTFQELTIGKIEMLVELSRNLVYLVAN
jgi:hypothetical protein